jgi:hypothetical protein
MLSGEFETYPVASITWDRANRTRREITEAAILEKQESIARIGLIHPLVITREGVGVSGETRWNAVTRLGWDRVPIQWADTLDPRELLAIELEENLKRTDLEWKDQVDGVRRYHELQRELHDSWSIEDTADGLGIARTTALEQLAVAKELAAGNTRVAQAKEYSVARGITRRTNERKAADEAVLLGIVEDIEPTLPESPILNVDFKEWVRGYRGAPFNFIHCDFPYGINADKFNQGAGSAFGAYEDTPETYWSLVDTLLENREKLMGDSCHLLFWFSMKFYAETLSKLREHFWVDPYPLIWHKTDNKGTLPDPERGPRRVYEVGFLCSHGDRKIVSAVANTFGAPTERLGEHMSEKSPAMLQHFFRMIVDQNTRMLDPTCGSGSALRAADALGAASVLGLELNPEFAEAATRAWLKRKG